MIKKVKLFFIGFFRIIFGLFLGLFIKRDNKTILFGSSPNTLFKENKRKDYFLHNTKYLFLYICNLNSDYKIIYLCDDKEMIKKFNARGFKNVFKRKSFKGFYYSLKSKFWVTDYDVCAVSNIFLSYGAICLNLWHGIPLKKIVFDNPKTEQPSKNPMVKFLRNIVKIKDIFFFVSGEYEKNCYKTAFLTEGKNIIITGSPRCDVLKNDIMNSDLFSEKDFEKIRYFKNAGKKVFIYMPTFRDNGEDVSSFITDTKIREFFKKNNSVLFCKLHPADKNSLDIKSDEAIYIVNKTTDVYALLKYTDALITDYSSVYFDYLLLDKPIIYYPKDIKKYDIERGFYAPYSEMTAGIKVYSDNELVNSIQGIIDGNDSFKEQRKLLRDKMFSYQDGKNCERVFDWIRSISK